LVASSRFWRSYFDLEVGLLAFYFGFAGGALEQLGALEVDLGRAALVVRVTVGVFAGAEV
jgi:hypothetical protein